VTQIEKSRVRQRIIDENRAPLLEEARELDRRERAEIRARGDVNEGFEGYKNHFLYFDFCGDETHLEWIGDLSTQLARGISKLVRQCSHSLYTEYLTSLDFSGHKISNNGLLDIANVLR